MSLIRDMYEESKDFTFIYRMKALLSPREWYYHHKWRKQRMDRGWSNRDTWAAGDYIAKITAEMLEYLNKHSMVSWPDWFEHNIIEEQGEDAYKDLQSIIDDINNYLIYVETSWGDGLNNDGPQPPVDRYFRVNWYDEKTNKKLTEAEVKRRIGKWTKESFRLYKRAQKAMSFFGQHFTEFWD